MKTLKKYLDKQMEDPEFTKEYKAVRKEMEAEDDFPFPKDSPHYFGEEFPDGRMTADFSDPNNRPVKNFRKVIQAAENLGRPLTEEELEELEK
jgi:hypothetical protein